MRLLLATLLLAALAAAVPAFAEESPQPLMEDRLPAPGGEITRVYLPGGPTVLLQPEKGSTAVSVALALPSGSRRDPSHRRGLAHLLEHLVYRATPHFSAGSLPLALEAVGARSGARTTPDSTVFWETVPAGQVDLALRIEADRLDGLTFSTKDLERERELVLAELADLRTRGAFQVEARLRRDLWPREGVLPAGDPEAVRQATADDLRALYGQAYRREHAVLAIVGGFNPEETVARLEELFPPPPDEKPEDEKKEAAPSEPPAPPESPPEELRAGLLMVALPAPSLDGMDFAALAVLDAALTDGATSRLPRALKGKARVEPDPALDDGFHRFTLYLEEGADPKEVEARLLQEVDALRTREMTPEELVSAERRARARYFRTWQSPGPRAVALAEAEAGGRLDALLDLPGRLLGLKALQVRESAARVLDLRRAKVYLPPAGGGAGEARPGPGAGVAEAGEPLETPTARALAAPGARPGEPSRGGARGSAEGRPGALDLGLKGLLAQAAGAPEPALPAFQRRRLDNGLTVLVWRDPSVPTVTVRGYLAGGALLDPPDREGLTALAARVLGRGTATRPGEAFQWDLEDRGMRLRFVGDRQVLFLEGWCLKEDLPRLVEMLADALRHPQPGPEAVREARGEALQAARRFLSTPSGRAELAFLSALYPAGHPYGRPAEGTESTIQAASADQVAAQITRVSRPDRLTLCFVGDLTEADVMQHLRPDLTSWFVDGPPPRGQAPEAPLPEAARVDVPGQGAFALVVAGHPGPSRRDPDWYAFNLLNQILGGNPATSRLALRIRDEERLGPSATARLVPLAGPAPWAVVLQVRPEAVDRALELVRSEMERLQKEPPSEEELRRAVQALEGRLDVSLADAGARAEMLATMEYYHLSDHYPRGFSGLYSTVTPLQILETARARLHPDRLVVVVAAPPAREGAAPSPDTGDVAPSPQPAPSPGDDPGKPDGTPAEVPESDPASGGGE